MFNTKGNVSLITFKSQVTMAKIRRLTSHFLPIAMAKFTLQELPLDFSEKRF